MDNNNNIDEIKSNVNKLIYFIQISGIVFIFVFIALLIYAIYYRENIREDWNNQRCKVYVMPFVSFFKPEGSTTTASENFYYCMGEVSNSVMKILLAPFYAILSIISTTLNSIIGVINTMRSFVNNIRSNTLNYIGDVTKRFSDFLGTMQFISVKLYNIMGKISGMQTVLQYMTVVSAYSLETIIFVIGDIVKAIIISLIALGAVLFWWFPPLAVALGGLAAGMGIAYCFDEDTLIDLNNKTQVKIKNIRLNDILYHNNKVLGIIKCNSKENELYLYCNKVIVSKYHLVYENNKWIYVYQSNNSTKINNYDKPFIYCLITSKNQIYSHNILFSDYEEINNNYINNLIKNHTLLYLNHEKNSLCNNININKKTDNSGFGGDTLIKIDDNYYKEIKNIKIGDTISQGIVKGIVEINPPDYIYKINGDICSGENILYHENKWNYISNIHNIDNIDNIIQCKNRNHTIFYHLIIDKGIIETKYNLYRDFTECQDKEFINKSQTIILNYLNKS